MSKQLRFLLDLVIVVGAIIGFFILTSRTEKEKELILHQQTIKHLTDSTEYAEIQASLVYSRRQIDSLQDSLQRAMTKNSDVKPVTLISYKEKIVFRDKDIPYKEIHDTLVKDIDSSLLILTPKPFEVGGPWLSMSGEVRKAGLHIDTLSINLEPTVVFGTKKGEVTALVGDKNPYSSFSETKLFTYKVKQKRWALVVGGGVGYSGKMYLGPQITFGYRIW